MKPDEEAAPGLIPDTDQPLDQAQQMEKLHDYQGVVGRLHTAKDEIKTKFQNWKDNERRESHTRQTIQQKYAYIYRKKTRCELVRVSAAVMGIEFSYAAETAFVSPTLLEIGVDHTRMTLVWALSPLVGFFLTPVLGSLSDRCTLNYGRRRPFILILSLGVLLGLILVPSGKGLGQKLGDYYPPVSYNSTASNMTDVDEPRPSHPWGVLFTILGTVLLDFDADACQSPARAYLLDVTIPEDHARGLSTFTIMAGLGGFMGYAMGGFNWDATWLGEVLGGHVKAVFSLITFIFVICVICTVTSFKEVPLDVIECDALSTETLRMQICKVESKQQTSEQQPIQTEKGSYGTLSQPTKSQEQGPQNVQQENKPDCPQEQNGHVNHGFEGNQSIDKTSTNEVSSPTLKEYLLSIIYMPYSLRILCLTNLFCWMAHVCYSLYFTDYVGEAVFGGDPMAPEGSEKNELYEEGVRFGCWGMSMYSLSCACYSLIIEKLIKKFKGKRVYVGGLLFYSSGMLLMALCKSKFAVIVFSWTAGVMYSTLFTMPYLLVANYHAANTFSETKTDGGNQQKRGLGTDVALVSSMVFLAQFTLSLCMGSIISYSGTTTAVVCVASFLSFCGSITATQVLYLDI